MLLFKLTFVGALAITASACEKPDPSPDVSPSPPATESLPAGVPSLTGASVSTGANSLARTENKDRIHLSPDDVAIAPGKLVRLAEGFTVTARQAPRGEPLATIPAADVVLEVSLDARGDYVLVLFPDPMDSTKEMAGWVSMNALANTAWARESPTSPGSTSNATCVGDHARMRTDRDFCAKPCADDAQCERGAGEVCDGLAYAVHGPRMPLTPARYCTSLTQSPM